MNPSSGNGVTNSRSDIANCNGESHVEPNPLARDLQNPETRKAAQEFLGNIIFDKSKEASQRHFSAVLLGSTEKSNELFDKVMMLLQNSNEPEEIIIAIEVIKHWGDSSHFEELEKAIERIPVISQEPQGIARCFDAMLQLDEIRTFDYFLKTLDSTLGDSPDMDGLANKTAPFIVSLKMGPPRSEAFFTRIKEVIMDENEKETHKFVALMALQSLGLTKEFVDKHIVRVELPKKPEQLSFFSLFAEVICRANPNIILNSIFNIEPSDDVGRVKICKHLLQMIVQKIASEKGPEFQISDSEKKLSEIMWHSPDTDDREFAIRVFSNTGKIEEVASKALENLSKVDGGKKFLGFLDFGRERKSNLKEFLEPIVGPLADHERLFAARILGLILKYRSLSGSVVGPKESIEVRDEKKEEKTAKQIIPFVDAERKIINALIETALDMKNSRELRIEVTGSIKAIIRDQSEINFSPDFMKMVEDFEKSVGTRRCNENKFEEVLGHFKEVVFPKDIVL